MLVGSPVWTNPHDVFFSLRKSKNKTIALFALTAPVIALYQHQIHYQPTFFDTCFVGVLPSSGLLEIPKHQQQLRRSPREHCAPRIKFLSLGATVFGIESILRRCHCHSIHCPRHVETMESQFIYSLRHSAGPLAYCRFVGCRRLL